ncbi:hypothetical protein BB559_004130 [Furculomyces boomerangus]|uniref:Vacuolar import/degradation Vid27 C-terminal domain-containing protein n=1 Tax=Furculomyces boomerangus TaxID=61424 RepID=A0A2T9YGJ6_9FUNG|nr:hypothetical protein BB559_004130 [Furculomyces boomerangus]
MFSFKGIGGLLFKGKENDEGYTLKSGQFYEINGLVKGKKNCLYKDSSLQILHNNSSDYSLVIKRIFEEGERELEEDQESIDSERIYLLKKISNLSFKSKKNNLAISWTVKGKTVSEFSFEPDSSLSTEIVDKLYKNLKKLHAEANNLSDTDSKDSHGEKEIDDLEASELVKGINKLDINTKKTPTKKHHSKSKPKADKKISTVSKSTLVESSKDSDDELEEILQAAEEEIAQPVIEVDINLPFSPDTLAEGEVISLTHGELYAFDAQTQTFQLLAPQVIVTVVKTDKFTYWLNVKSLKKYYSSQKIEPRMNSVFNSEYMSMIWNVFGSQNQPYSLSVVFIDEGEYLKAHESLIKAAYEVLNMEPWEKVKKSDQEYMLGANEESLEFNDSQESKMSDDSDDSIEESEEEEGEESEEEESEEEESEEEGSEEESEEGEENETDEEESEEEDVGNKDSDIIKKTCSNRTEEIGGLEKTNDYEPESSSGEYDESGSSEDESEDEGDELSESKHNSSLMGENSGKDNATNSALAVGYRHDRSYVLRGNQIGVFRHTEDNDIEHTTTIKQISDTRGNVFTPSKMMLHEQDSSIVMMNPMNPSSLYKMDLEVGKVVEEWKVHEYINPKDIVPETKYAQMSTQKTLLGISHNALFKIDPRVSGDKLVESQFKQYTTKNKFSSAATNEKGNIVVASEKGEIRLFDRVGVMAKTALPALGEPIIGVDVTADGRYIVATFASYLLLIDTLIPQEFLTRYKNSTEKITGFLASFPKNAKPMPKRLQLRPEHIVYMGTAASFTPARFNTSSGHDGTGSHRGERTIVTSSGSFVIIWNLRKVLATGRGDLYHIKQYSDTVIADNFTFGEDQNIVVTMPNDVTIVEKKNMAKPSRKTLTVYSTPVKRNLLREDIIRDWEIGKIFEQRSNDLRVA